MRVSTIVSLGATVVSTALAQSTFEPADFNATEALLQNGVDESILIKLEESLDGSLSRRTSSCSIACSTLKAVFGSSKVKSDDVLSYWSLVSDEDVPTCTFQPASTLEVSTFVLLTRLTQCPFATKGGGHLGFAGANNIDGGITLSLERFKNIDVLPGNDKIVAIGPGNRWLDVYTTLEKQNLAVAGGRSYGVGVSGLVLGGGISHHINSLGFTCDTIAAFEVVTSSGIIVKATPTKYADLYWALRGGGGNFGIVTNFFFEAFEQGPIWAGDRVVDESQAPAVYQAFANAVKNAAQDTKATHYFALSTFQQQGVTVKYVSPGVTYTEVPSSPPAIFDEYLAIPYLVDDIKETSLANFTLTIDAGTSNPGRQHFWAIPAMKVDVDLIKYMGDLILDPETNPDIEGVTNVVSMTVQAISVPALQQMTKKGGNAVGLKASEGPLFHCMLYVRWDGGAAEDKLVYDSLKAFEDKVVAEAERRGLATGYTYMNYAGPYAKVVEGYGSANQKRLQSISKKYDPTAVFLRLQPGGHKLEGSPIKI